MLFFIVTLKSNNKKCVWIGFHINYFNLKQTSYHLDLLQHKLSNYEIINIIEK